MKPELEKLDYYFPYGVIVANYNHFFFYRLLSLCENGDIDLIDLRKEWDGENHYGSNFYSNTSNKPQYFPVLHPMSDLDKEITINGHTFTPAEQLEIVCYGEQKICSIYRNSLLKHPDAEPLIIDNLPWKAVKRLLEWKFDVFNLIEHKQAIDVNTLANNPYK